MRPHPFGLGAWGGPGRHAGGPKGAGIYWQGYISFLIQFKVTILSGFICIFAYVTRMGLV